MRSNIGRSILAEVPLETRLFIKKYAGIVLRIHELLEEKGMSQKELAEAMEKSPAEVSRWLSGNGNLTLKSIAKIEAVLGANVIEIPIQSSKAISLPEQNIPVSYKRLALPSTSFAQAGDFAAAAVPCGAMPVPTFA